EPLLLADRGDAAGHVARGPLGGGDLGHDGLLAADRGGQGLEVELAVHWHDAYREDAAVDRCHQRLEYALRRHAKRLAGLKAVRPGPRVMVVLVQGERDLRPVEGDRRRGTASSHEPHLSA